MVQQQNTNNTNKQLMSNETTGRTADYECGDLGIEVTSFLAKEFV